MKLKTILSLLTIFFLFQNCSPYRSAGTNGSNTLLSEAPEPSTDINPEPFGEMDSQVVEQPTEDISGLTNNNESPITWPYTFTWDPTAFNVGSKIDLWINGVDQGKAIPAADGKWTINTGPTGEINVELIEVFPDLTSVVHDEKVFTITTPAPTTPNPNPIGSLIKSIKIPNNFVSIVDNNTWRQITSNTHIFLTGSPNKLSIVKDEEDWWIRAKHLAGQVADLTQASSIPSARSTTVDFKIKFAPNWVHGKGHYDSGKLGWGLAGGAKANNVIVSGGSTENTGWSIRWGFDSNYLILYAYYANRPGMNYPGTPPKVLVGQLIKTDVKIIPGQSYSLSMTVTTNEANLHNGSLKASINGVEKINIKGMYYMSGTPETDRLFFASNHGGNASNLDWAPPVDTWVQYKDISVRR